jgi:predicted nucleic acid-binding protein
MTGFLLDTNVPSELTRPKPDRQVEKWLDDADDQQLFFSVVSLGEVYKGLAIVPEGKRRQELQRWIDETLRPWFANRILPVSEAIAERWGLLAGQCQLRGRPLKVADGLIAATALEHGLTVVTRNVRDFADLGVSVFNPWPEHRVERDPAIPHWPESREPEQPEARDQAPDVDVDR